MKERSLDCNDLSLLLNFATESVRLQKKCLQNLNKFRENNIEKYKAADI